MGLKEYLKAGAVLRRDSISILTSPLGSGSVDLGSAYVLYTVETDTTCRLRLYDTVASVNNVVEKSRVFGDTNISASIALIADFTILSGSYTLDPVLYGVVQSPLSKLTYYKIDDAVSPPTLTFSRYLLEDSLVSTASRVTLPEIQKEIPASTYVLGSFAQTNVPKTYLFVSASVSNTSAPIRVRFYSIDTMLYDPIEQARPFHVESQTPTLLLDAILTGNETTYFVPKIIGANLQNMGTNLNLIKNSYGTLAGKSEIYYNIENLQLTGSIQLVTASFHVFSLED